MRPPSPPASIPSASSSTTRPCVAICAAPCGLPPTSRVRARGWLCSAGDRAISRPCATVWRPRADVRGCSARVLAASVCRTGSPASTSASLNRVGSWPIFRPDLDAARTLRDDSRKVMAELEAKYLEETAIKSLKVRHNNILGFYVEVPAAQAKPLLSGPLALIFRHRQTMAGALRFATEELVATESRIVTSADRALALEQEVFAEL